VMLSMADHWMRIAIVKPRFLAAVRIGCHCGTATASFPDLRHSGLLSILTTPEGSNPRDGSRVAGSPHSHGGPRERVEFYPAMVGNVSRNMECGV
jgi:hypothetical protein